MPAASLPPTRGQAPTRVCAAETMSQDPLQQGNQAEKIVLDIRKRKGLKEFPAPLSEYEDKL